MTGLDAFQARAFESEAGLYGRDATIAGKSVRLLARKSDSLENSMGGFEDTDELTAQIQGDAPAVHALCLLGGKNYRVNNVQTLGGNRHSFNLRPIGSTK
jgi:hypothetical protein